MNPSQPGFVLLAVLSLCCLLGVYVGAIELQPAPLLQELATANLDYFGDARVFRYPDPPGQTKEELVTCYRSKFRECGSNFSDPCDPDDDASGHAHSGHVYLPEDLAELFLLTTGNVKRINDPNIDFYVVNPFVVLSAAVEDCNGMNHTDRMRYWGNLLTKSPATKFGTRVTQKHVFVGVSWTVSKLLYRSEEGQKLCQLANKMTFLINEDNHKWAGMQGPHARGTIMVVPYLSHRYLVPAEIGADAVPRQKIITFIGTLRANFYRLAGAKIKNMTWAHVGVSRRFETDVGKRHQLEALNYSNTLRQSTYCLHLPGDTITSRRIFDAINAGCIPVIVTGTGWKVAQKSHKESFEAWAVASRRDKTLHNLPFSDVIPYEKFSIFLDGAEWENNTVEAARRVVETPDHTLKELQENLVIWRNFFDYRSPGAELQGLVVSQLVKHMNSLHFG